MKLSDYTAEDATGLSELIKSKDVSVAEVTACAIEALERAHGALNCMVEIYDEPWSTPSNLEAAFYGVPFVYKDAGAHEDGVRQEVGSRLGAGLPAAGDTAYANRIKALGLLNLGRSTTSELTYATVTETSACGDTRNPWNLDHSPGGSSGGSAAAVASGAVPLAHATDGGGSIRAPAAWTGLIGLKPSRGSISWAPGAGEMLFGMAGEFALCRSVRDARTLFTALRGHESGDPYRLNPVQHDNNTAGSYRDKKIGLITSPWTNALPMDQACVSAAETAANWLSDDCTMIEPVELGIDGDVMISAITDVWCGQIALLIDQVVAATGRDPEQHLDQALFTCYQHGAGLSAGSVFAAVSVFNQVTRSVAKVFDQYDFILTPSTATPAPKIGDLDARTFDGDAVSWTQSVFASAPFLATINILGAPAISLPTQVHDTGLPIGVQVIAKHGQDEALLDLAAWFELNEQFIPSRPPGWIS